MPTIDSEIRQLKAQMSRTQTLIATLEDLLEEKPNDAGRKRELQRKQTELQGLRSELEDLEKKKKAKA